MRASYKAAVKWIADNDGDASTCRTAEEVAQLLTVCLVADVWSMEPLTVARSVRRLLNKLNNYP